MTNFPHKMRMMKISASFPHGMNPGLKQITRNLRVTVTLSKLRVNFEPNHDPPATLTTPQPKIWGRYPQPQGLTPLLLTSPGFEYYSFYSVSSTE